MLTKSIGRILETEMTLRQSVDPLAQSHTENLEGKVVQLVMGDESLLLLVKDGEISVQPGESDNPDLQLSGMHANLMVALATNATPGVTIDGDFDLLADVRHFFQVPLKTTDLVELARGIAATGVASAKEFGDVVADSISNLRGETTTALSSRIADLESELRELAARVDKIEKS